MQNPNFRIQKRKIKEKCTLDKFKYMLDHFTSVELEEGGTNWRFEALLMEENKGWSVAWIFLGFSKFGENEEGRGRN